MTPANEASWTLSYHCSYDTRYESDQTVVLDKKISFYNEFKNFDVNDYLKDWKILEIIEDEECAYLGIIYKNDKAKQLVLAHRSTNFKISLRKNIFKQSGVQLDIEGVLMGNIVGHQAFGCYSTQKAIDFAKVYYNNYSLSFTGHSLGAWLAELSVFYCHKSFDFPRVQAVTFDGPGSRQMMEKLLNNFISEIDRNFPYMEIFSYLSLPSLVNCTNIHVGKVFCLFPTNLDYKIENIIKDNIKTRGFLKNILLGISENIPDKAKDTIESLVTHDLKYILPLFDTLSGKPACKKVKKWPSISYDKNEFNKNSTKHPKLIESIFPSLLTKVLKYGFKIAGSKYEWENTTADSIFHLFTVMYHNEIDLSQYFELNKNLREENSKAHEIKFFSEFKSGYKVENLDSSKSEYNKDSHIDKYMETLSKCNDIDNNELKKIAGLYRFKNYPHQIFELEEIYRQTITLEDVREKVACLWHRLQDFDHKLEAIYKVQIKTNIPHSNDMNQSDKIYHQIIKKKLESNQILLFIGTDLYSILNSYATLNEDFFTTRLINAHTQSQFEIDINNCYLEKRRSINELMEFFVRNLRGTKQRVLFIIDFKQQFKKIDSYVMDFIKNFIDLGKIQFIITAEKPLANLYSIESSFQVSEFERLNDEDLENLMENLANEWKSRQVNFFKDRNNVRKMHRFIENFSISISSLQKEISTYKRQFTNLDAKIQHVFVIGPTGSGKSTIINLLLGNALISKEDKDDINSENLKIELVDKTITNFTAIGNDNLKSETSVVRPYFKENYVFWDFPGFYDSHKCIQRIRFAYEMKNISKEVKKFKIVLVLENSIISTSKGSNFIKFAKEILSQLGSFEEMKENLSLIITKCKNLDYQTQITVYDKNFKGIRDKNTEITLLNLFCEMQNKIALFPKIEKENLILKPSDFNLDIGLKYTECKEINFNLALDLETMDVVGKLNEMFNEYAVYCAEESIKNREKDLKEIMAKDSFKKENLNGLKYKLPEDRNSTEEGKKFFSNNLIDNCIEAIIEILNFYKNFDTVFYPKFENWFSPFVEFNRKLEDFFKGPLLVLSPDKKKLKIISIILSATEINKIETGKIIDLKVVCDIFILDENLLLNGINLLIQSPDWRVDGENKRVILKGFKSNPNSGSFYSPPGLPKSIRGGIVIFDLNGFNGEHGAFEQNLKEIMDKTKLSADLNKKRSAILNFKNFFQNSDNIAREITEQQIKKNSEIRLLLLNRCEKYTRTRK